MAEADKTRSGSRSRCTTRHRGPAQRGQIHALQPADRQAARHRRRRARHHPRPPLWRTDWQGRHLRVVDTGGIIPEEKEFIPAEIFRQARVALDEADAVVMVVDGRTELAAPDLELARLLRRRASRCSWRSTRSTRSSRRRTSKSSGGWASARCFPSLPSTATVWRSCWTRRSGRRSTQKARGGDRGGRGRPRSRSKRPRSRSSAGRTWASPRC